MIRPPPRSTPFPYPTLFRSSLDSKLLRLTEISFEVFELMLCLFDSFSIRLPASWRVRRHLSLDRKSTRLNSSHSQISYAVFCLKKNKHLRDHVAPVCAASSV